MNQDDAPRHGGDLVAAWDFDTEEGRRDFTVFDGTVGDGQLSRV